MQLYKKFLSNNGLKIFALTFVTVLIFTFFYDRMKPFVFKGTVYNINTALPIQNANIEIYLYDIKSEKYLLVNSNSDEFGNYKFEFRNIIPNNVQFRISKEQFISDTISPTFKCQVTEWEADLPLSPLGD